MKKRRIIEGIISIAVSVILGVFLFNNPDFIKMMTSDYEVVILTPAQNFVKNIAISLFCGGAIYAIFYAVPHEYKLANTKKRDE